MFKKYHVNLKFKNEFAAGLPKNPETLLDFLKARAPERKPEEATPLEELAEEIEEEIYTPTSGQEAEITTTFKQIEGKLVYEARCIKSHIKDCANVLRRRLGTRGLKTLVADRIHVEPQFIPLKRREQVITDPDGKEIRPVTIRTRQGPRSAVKIVEFVRAPEMEFDLIVLDDRMISQEMLKDLFTYGGTIKGMGQDRGLGWGRYEFEIREVR